MYPWTDGGGVEGGEEWDGSVKMPVPGEKTDPDPLAIKVSPNKGRMVQWYI